MSSLNYLKTFQQFMKVPLKKLNLNNLVLLYKTK